MSWVRGPVLRFQSSEVCLLVAFGLWHQQDRYFICIWCHQHDFGVEETFLDEPHNDRQCSNNFIYPVLPCTASCGMKYKFLTRTYIFVSARWRRQRSRKFTVFWKFCFIKVHLDVLNPSANSSWSGNCWQRGDRRPTAIEGLRGGFWGSKCGILDQNVVVAWSERQTSLRHMGSVDSQAQLKKSIWSPL